MTALCRHPGRNDEALPDQHLQVGPGLLHAHRGSAPGARLGPGHHARRTGQWPYSPTQDPDAARLRRAFLALAGSARRWPSPADLLDHLPAKPQPPALPAPPRGRTGAAHLQAMKDLIARATKTLPGTTPRSKQP